MSQENVEVVRRFYFEGRLDLAAAFEDEGVVRGLLASLEPLVDEGFEAVFDPAAASGLGDFDPVRPGLEGMLDAWREWLTAWESYYVEPKEFIVVDSDRVLVPSTITGTSRAHKSRSWSRPVRCGSCAADR